MECRKSYWYTNSGFRILSGAFERLGETKKLQNCHTLFFKILPTEV